MDGVRQGQLEKLDDDYRPESIAESNDTTLGLHLRDPETIDGDKEHVTSEVEPPEGDDEEEDLNLRHF